MIDGMIHIDIFINLIVMNLGPLLILIKIYIIC